MEIICLLQGRIAWKEKYITDDGNLLFSVTEYAVTINETIY